LKKQLKYLTKILKLRQTCSS